MTSLVVASVYVLVSVGNALGESWTYFFALAVGLVVIVLGLILRNAWTWPRTAARRDAPSASQEAPKGAATMHREPSDRPVH